MKRILKTFFAAVLLAAVAGCACQDVRCEPCARRCGGLFGNRCKPAACPQEQAGPAPGVVTYPYYTLRGPRDFLQRTPTPIGP